MPAGDLPATVGAIPRSPIPPICRPTAWQLTCDAQQIGQALTNLLKNAAEAIDARIAATGNAEPPGQIHLTLRESDDDVVLSIEDNGRGLPDQGRERLTEPYVTTRARGTGLGLAIVKNIVEDHGALLQLDDRPGGGAIVRVTFRHSRADDGGRSGGAERRHWRGRMAAEILIVDDEADIRMLIGGILADEGYETRDAADSAAALEAIARRRPSLVVLDIWLQGSDLDGLQLLEVIRRDHPTLPVVMISGHGNYETTFAAVKLGANDYIEKPFKADHLLMRVQKVVTEARLKRENEELRSRLGSEVQLLGTSSPIAAVRQAIERVAPTSSRVLITGPAGSGKEVVARLLHQQSRRADGPFVVLNCAIMRPDRVEIELFGTEAGAEGPGSPATVGTFEQAHGGTLLLDEVSDLPLETQGKMVRVLQEQTFERVGGKTRVSVDVRVIAATNRDLQVEMAEGRFRQDLFYRLSVVPIRRAGAGRAARGRADAGPPFHASAPSSRRACRAAPSPTTPWRC